MTVAALLAAYRSGEASTTEVVELVYSRIERQPHQPVWTSVVSRDRALARARALAADPRALARPLYGIPFAVKDNIDVAGMETTAACPAFSYRAERNASVVTRLLDAGAILVGKTNMDQFATGLVGTRSPYGVCTNAFDERYISGGSSSGSAVAVAKELVSFSLGTDTAGSGRVPAAFNNLVGLKPTRGSVSTAGVVPACRSLDCVSIFAASVSDARAVLHVASGNDDLDAYSRRPGPGAGSAPWLDGPSFRFGCPPREQLKFFGDVEAEALFDGAVERLKEIGGRAVEIDFSPFRDAAALLYSGPWVAERLAAVEAFLRRAPEAMHPVVREIISGGARFSAVDAFRAAYQLEALRRRTQSVWADIDVLVLPTAQTIYTIEEVLSQPVESSSRLGYYTNFVNLLDLAAIAVPAGFRTNGLPFGISLIGRAWSDEALLALSERYLTGDTPVTAPGCVAVAVAGAHLTGQPLNRQLTEREARFVRACRTAPEYRLYALTGTKPSKPGLVRDPSFRGPGIEVEVWSVPENEFGSFVAAIPPPLGIGSAVLEDGSTVKCFICEPFAIAAATEITQFGGWRNYLATL